MEGIEDLVEGERALCAGFWGEPLLGEEGVGGGDQRDVVVPSRPGAALEVVQAQAVLELPVWRRRTSSWWRSARISISFLRSLIGSRRRNVKVFVTAR
ncbi:hypothetical protein SNA_16335 [Streptomyces natalensis ATCC 27448]|uniref:Uncharacterized protein n=1 Tax=Streptomyces natalensis ATCC 27448 TaxID=1240678 RepID=A0A0D7CK52_9ACTN|nr:hypothetical protein SNA_16335 [Streptomyces natalensis ATCC 27448]